MDLFNSGKKPLKIDKPIRLIELFAGIGSQAKALERIGADFEHYRICEFDKYAVTSYNAIHNTNFATSDITQLTADDLGIVDTDKYCYVMTYSFPCQDLSLAGKQKGMAKGENTRSGLLWEVERLLNECDELPQVLLMENVTQVHGKKNVEHFNEWMDFLENTKKQQAKGNGFKFAPTDGNVCAKAVTTRAGGRMDDNFIEEQPILIGGMQKNQSVKTDGISTCLTSSMGTGGGYVPMITDPKCVEVEPIRIGGLYDNEKGKHQAGAIWDKETIAPTVDTMQGGNRQPLITEEPLAYDEQNGYIRKDGTVGTLTTDGSSPKHNNRVVESEMRIRKLTPKECWRLMGFDDADFEKAAQFNSNSQLYKQAGNSIVVDVLYYIFGVML